MPPTETQPLADETPAERRRQRVRSAILEAAERVFSCEGETGLSIRRLAEEIDYSPAAIYKYFGSKEELLDELKEAFFERLMSSMDRTALAALPFRERVCRCIENYIAVATARPHHYAAAFASSAEQDEAGAETARNWETFLLSVKGQAFMVIVGLVEEGQADGTFVTGVDPVEVAKSLWASMHGIAMLLIHLPQFPALSPQPEQGPDVPAFVRFHADLMFRSLCANPPPPITPGPDR